MWDFGFDRFHLILAISWQRDFLKENPAQSDVIQLQPSGME